ncbi:helix-turn-helix domain-containing protein [Catenuloplanes indicus]|uniref:DUF5753 domain-containing protein n=1 Tax=Catenuloplanes indicus TaxID=137267 RepID=A0AAE4B0U1_9ACTN|nr:helix-turn-helix transcriptional regulator [Catenuloplanes indicus]MDQ0368986.1 hypothetical protein [Catenuloplanes indicus]
MLQERNSEVDNVPRETGPTIARLQLGGQLRTLREGKEVKPASTADLIGGSVSKVYKIESGDIAVGKSDLMVMLRHYGVDEGSALWVTMLDLQRRSKERGWWASFGALPDAHAAYVGLESGAKTVKNFELAVVPGLLQTEDYAQVIVSANRPDDPAEAHRRTALRVRRQEALTTNDDPLELWAIMDEAVLRRATGGPAVMRAQLRHLLDMTKLPNVNILVVPFAEGWHPGTFGSFVVLEFDPEIHSPIVYIETPAGEQYLEREQEVRRVMFSFSHLQSAALSVSKSRALIEAIAKDLA